MWTDAAGDGFAVGEDATILRVLSGTWTVVQRQNGGTPFFEVGGHAPDDLFVAGSGVFLHWNATAWVPIAPPTPWFLEELASLGGTSQEVFATTNRELLYWDGAHWSRVRVDGSLGGIAATSGLFVFPRNDELTALRRDVAW